MMDASSVTDRPHCQGFKANGEPCRVTFGLSDGLCLNHDPARREAAREARRAGGSASGVAKRARREAQPKGAKLPRDVPAAPQTLEDSAKYAAWIVNACATGALDARTSHECAFALKVFESSIEKRDLLAQIKQLKKELAEARRRPGQPRGGPFAPRVA